MPITKPRYTVERAPRTAAVYVLDNDTSTVMEYFRDLQTAKARADVLNAATEEA